MGYRTTKSKIKVGSSKTNNYTEFYYHFFCNILLVSIPLVIISALVLSLPHSSARVSSSDNFTVSVLSSCTLNSKVNDEHSINTINGTYNADVGRTTLTTFCNDRNGYVVYAVGDSDNTIGNNKLISSINSNYDIVSGTDTSGNTSQWAMKLSALSDNIGDTNNPGYITNNSNETVATNQGTDTPIIDPSYNNTFGYVPTTWTRVVYKPSGTVNSTSGSSFSTTYSIYTSPTQPAGTYTGQVKYLLTHPSSAGPDTGYIMQEVAEWKDDVLVNIGDTVIATDERDGKGYYVTRLADGHIWMTQNLDFDITNTTLNSATTDLNAIYDPSTGQYAEYNDGYSENNGIIYWKPANTATTIDFKGTTVADWQNSNTEPYSASKTDSAGTGHASLGNYYNWTAAIASNNSSSLTQDTLSDISNNPKNSICPKGWRLPTISDDSASTAGSTNEFARLNYLYNNSSSTIGKLIHDPIYFLRAGYIDGFYTGHNRLGSYWSSTFKENKGYRTFSYGDSYSPSAAGDRYYGFSVRCVARSTSE